MAELTSKDVRGVYDCERCRVEKGAYRDRMILCPKCGNKRCPKACDHRFKCTGSNAVSQVGQLEDSDN